MQCPFSSLNAINRWNMSSHFCDLDTFLTLLMLPFFFDLDDDLGDDFGDSFGDGDDDDDTITSLFFVVLSLLTFLIIASTSGCFSFAFDDGFITVSYAFT